MKIIPTKLQKYLKLKDWTPEEFAKILDVDISEVKKLLEGESVNRSIAEKFIKEIGVDTSLKLIDWKAIGRKKPKKKYLHI